ncbi:GntR family transcriptional regulator [Luteococcus peritonei]|uniref:GntR family transcriptional regulator n=1 Tax=Luteococcus peritonei TaxID=88874 RepID=A0ABW4RUK0_9ACTN
MVLQVQIRDDDPRPPYEQVRAQISSAIATGDLPTGTRIPPVRQLAGDLGVAAGTVARAYKELEAAGLVATARRAGTTVIGHPDDSHESALNALAADFVQQARRLGAGNQAVRAAVEHHLA